MLRILFLFYYRYNQHDEKVGAKRVSIKSFFTTAAPKKKLSVVENDASVFNQSQQSSSLTLPDMQDVRENVNNREKINDFAFIFSRKKVSEFLKTHCQQLASEDVLSNKPFIEGIEHSVKSIVEYMNLFEKYSQNKHRKKETDLSKKLTDINKMIDTLKQKMGVASSIKIDMKMGTQQLSVSAALKQEHLGKVMSYATEIKELLKKEEVIMKLKKRSNQQLSIKNKEALLMEKNELNLKCLNSTLEWEKAYEKVITQTVQNLPFGTSVLEMQQLATIVEEESFVDGKNVIEPDRSGKINFLLENFPIMFASKEGKELLINIHELLINKDTFIALLIDVCMYVCMPFYVVHYHNNLMKAHHYHKSHQIPSDNLEKMNIIILVFK